MKKTQTEKPLEGNQATLVSLIVDILSSKGVKLPDGWRYENGKGRLPECVGVPVSGNGAEAREILVCRLVQAGRLFYAGSPEVQDGHIHVTNRPLRKPRPIPWANEFIAKSNLTGDEPEAVEVTYGSRGKTKKSRTKKEQEAPSIPCACGCGGLARKAFVITHDAKFSSALGKLGKGVLSAEEAEAVKKQASIAAQNPHVAGSAYFKKRYAFAGLASMVA